MEDYQGQGYLPVDKTESNSLIRKTDHYEKTRSVEERSGFMGLSRSSNVVPPNEFDFEEDDGGFENPFCQDSVVKQEEESKKKIDPFYLNRMKSVVAVSGSVARDQFWEKQTVWPGEMRNVVKIGDAEMTHEGKWDILDKFFKHQKATVFLLRNSRPIIHIIENQENKIFGYPPWVNYFLGGLWKRSEKERRYYLYVDRNRELQPEGLLIKESQVVKKESPPFATYPHRPERYRGLDLLRPKFEGYVRRHKFFTKYKDGVTHYKDCRRHEETINNQKSLYDTIRTVACFPNLLCVFPGAIVFFILLVSFTRADGGFIAYAIGCFLCCLISIILSCLFCTQCCTSEKYSVQRYKYYRCALMIHDKLSLDLEDSEGEGKVFVGVLFNSYLEAKWKYALIEKILENDKKRGLFDYTMVSALLDIPTELLSLTWKMCLQNSESLYLKLTKNKEKPAMEEFSQVIIDEEVGK